MQKGKRYRGPLISLFMICFASFIGQAQEMDTLKKDSVCEPKDMVDYIRQWFHIKAKEKKRTSSIFLAPVFGSSPSTGFVIGATVQGAFQLPGSRLSAFQSNVQYTTKKQFSVSLKNNVFAKKNRIFLSGDWSYFDYAQPTYGLGTNAPRGTLPAFFHFNDIGEPTDSLAQPMRYKYYKLHQTFSWRVAENLFIGPGIHLDYYTGIEDQKLDTPVHYITSHYAYSKKYGFDPNKYSVAGLSLNLVLDSRDNMINAYRGIYANLNYRFNPGFMGSDEESSTLWAEFRTYLSMSKKRPGNILAFWGIGHFTVSGHLPYLALPFLGNDQRARMGRGYTIARYRGNNMIYGEAEYRLPISKCTQTLGAVFFVNLITTSNKDGQTALFEYVQPGFGAGLRVLFTKRSRMNITVDYGRGTNSGGVYFGASEVF